jgi:hypothetical protein
VGRRARTPRAAPIAALIAALLLSSPAAAEELQQILEFQVSAPSGVVFEDVVVVFDRLGEEIEVVLADDGRDWVDLANDGVYLGRHQGEYSRYISVRIRANLQDGTSPEIYSGVVRTGDRHRAELGWIVMTGQNGSLKAMRAATAYPGNRVWHQDVAQLVASAGWAVFLLYYVSRLVWLRRKERAGCPPSNAPS